MIENIWGSYVAISTNVHTPYDDAIEIVPATRLYSESGNFEWGEGDAVRYPKLAHQGSGTVGCRAIKVFTNEQEALEWGRANGAARFHRKGASPIRIQKED